MEMFKNMFGKNIMGGKKGPSKILKFMMFKEMLKGDKKGGTEGNSLGNMLPFLLMGKNEDLFEGMFDFDEEEEEDDVL